jgi:small-conductance mechanosensitive channel
MNRPNTENKFVGFFKNVVIAISVFVIFYLISILLNKIFEKYIDKNDKLNVSKSLFYDFIKKLINFGLMSAAFLFAAAQLGFNMGTIMVILGSVGLALALSMKDFLGQFIAGLVILSFQYYNVGDLIHIDQETGIVSGFNLLNTTLTTPQNIVIIIPNNDFMSKSFTNYSRNEFIFVGAEICISNNAKADYENLIKKLEKEIKKIHYIENNETSIKLDSMAGPGTKILVQIRIKPANYVKAKKELHLVSRLFMEKENILLCDNYYIK